jgi:hypothetical protein
MENPRHPNAAKGEIKRLKFTQDEDEGIVRLVAECGTSDWSMIASKLGGDRTKRQVRERWQNYINPELNAEYTEAEDCLLESLFEQLGPKWSTIAVALHRKSGISVRNRHRTLQTLSMRGFKPDYDRGPLIPRPCEAESITEMPIVTDDVDVVFNNFQCQFPNDWCSEFGLS